jgi:hypothetical protein
MSSIPIESGGRRRLMHYLSIASLVNKIINMVKDGAYYTPEHIYSIVQNWVNLLRPSFDSIKKAPSVDYRSLEGSMELVNPLENRMESLIIDGILIGNMYNHVKAMDHLTFQSFERRWRSRHHLLRRLYYGVNFENSPTTFRIHFLKKHIDVHIPGLFCEFCRRQLLHSADSHPVIPPYIRVQELVATPRMIRSLECTRGMNFDDYEDVTLTGYRNSLCVSKRYQVTRTNGTQITWDTPVTYHSKEDYRSLLTRIFMEPDGTVWQDLIPIMLDLMSKFTKGNPQLYRFERRREFVPFIRYLKEPELRNHPLFHQYAFSKVYHLMGFDIPQRKITQEESSEQIPKRQKTKHE